MPSNHLILSRPLLLHPQSFPGSESFQMSQFFTSGGQRIGASASVLPMNAQGWFLGWTSWTPCSPRDSQESSPTPRFKSINSSVLSFLYSPTLTSIHNYWKNHGLTRWTFVGKVMSLLFNMLSRLVVTFLPRRKCLLISWLQSPSAVTLEPQKIFSHCFPIYSPRSDGTRCHGLSFWMLNFKPTFSLSFTFIKRLFSPSLLSSIRVVSSAYLRLLIFLPAILLPACVSSSPMFLLMYSACELNKQGDNIQPWCTPFPIWNQSVVPCPLLTVASWPAYRFLKRQIRWSGIPISWRIFHSLLLSTQSNTLA